MPIPVKRLNHAVLFVRDAELKRFGSGVAG